MPCQGRAGGVEEDINTSTDLVILVDGHQENDGFDTLKTVNPLPSL